MAELNERQKLFCEEYLKDRNATQAAIRAGYSPKTAQPQSARLLSNVMVQEYIQHSVKEISDENRVTAERVILELAKGAFAELDTTEMKFSDKLKCLELLCKHLGLLDGQGAGKGDKSNVKAGLLEVINRIGIGGKTG